MLGLLALFGCVECDPAEESCVVIEEQVPDRPVVPPTPEDPYVTERLEVSLPQVDLLFVVDNSTATHASTLPRMADDFPEMFDSLEALGVDYHIGVAVSEQARVQGELLGWTGSRERLGQLMRQAMPSPTADAGFGRLTAYRALRTRLDGANAGFRRTDAELHLVFVSGQDDRSVNPDATEFTSWLRLDPARGGYAHAVAAQGAPMYERYVDATGGQYVDERTGRLRYAGMWGELAPPRLYLSQLPLDPGALSVELEVGQPGDDEFGIAIAEVCFEGDIGPDCTLFYEPGTNALDWVEPPAAPIRAAVVTYESQR